jgi:hypothetical protein
MASYSFGVMAFLEEDMSFIFIKIDYTDAFIMIFPFMKVQLDVGTKMVCIFKGC